jgi:hypothetical protein
MKIEYHNLYTHFIFSTLHRLPVIPEKKEYGLKNILPVLLITMIRICMLYMLIRNMLIFLYPVLQKCLKRTWHLLWLKVLSAS